MDLPVVADCLLVVEELFGTGGSVVSIAGQLETVHICCWLVAHQLEEHYKATPPEGLWVAQMIELVMSSVGCMHLLQLMKV